MDATISKIKIIEEPSAAVSIRDTFYTRHGKRILDIIFAAVGLIITLPVNLVLALCTYIDVGRPLLFKQQRPGRNGVLFTIYKFRNMTDEVDENGVLLAPELRVTKFGRFVRSKSLDELLQFWNILKGEMSVIGPRPLLKEYLLIYTPREACRHIVRPGLECPTLRPNGQYWTWQSRFENDLWYVRNVSLMIDIKLFIRVIQSVFNKNDVKIRSTATLVDFTMSDRLAALEADEIGGCGLREYRPADAVPDSASAAQPWGQEETGVAI
jgi:lipopolysaccharide/colanic/teichoic acid biosynthesis glycosyltransferase